MKKKTLLVYFIATFMLFSCSKKAAHKSIYGVVLEDDLKLRSNPAGKIIGKLKIGTKVVVISRTKNKYNIGDRTNYWYKIKVKNGTVGWSFGDYIQIADGKSGNNNRFKLTAYNFFLYAANMKGDSVSMYEIDAQGKLVLAGYAKAVYKPRKVVAHPFKNYVYVIDRLKLVSYKCMKNGRLYPVGAIQTGEGILDLRVHPEGNFLYATRLNPLINISTFKIQSDGRAKASGDILTNSKPRNIGFSPLGKKVYITDVHKNNKILIFDFQLSGKLLDNGNFDIPGTKYTGKIAISPDGKKLFYADLRAGRILAYSLDKTKGYNKENELVSSGPPVNLIFDNEGNYLYILCSNNKIDIFKIDETGIKKSATVNTGKYPFEAVFHPGGKYFYVALRDENKIAAYAVSENGNLTEIGSFASGKYPVSLALAKVRK